ncbi:MAG: hypothetical protein ACLP9L_02315 [Thermoguttaceae bacterium]
MSSQDVGDLVPFTMLATAPQIEVLTSTKPQDVIEVELGTLGDQCVLLSIAAERTGAFAEIQGKVQ